MSSVEFLMENLEVLRLVRDENNLICNIPGFSFIVISMIRTYKASIKLKEVMSKELVLWDGEDDGEGM